MIAFLFLFLLSNNLLSQSGWIVQATSNNIPRSVYFIDENIGWIAGEYSLIMHTTNGGVNWFYQDSPSNYHQLNYIQFVDQNTGWIAGDSVPTNPFDPVKGIIYKTTNGGANWFIQYNQNIGYLWGGYFFNYNTGWVVGTTNSASALLMSTTNGGINWINQNVPGQYLNSIYFVNQNTGWAVGFSNSSGEIIIKTTDGGLNWMNQSSTSRYVLSSVHFINESTGWAVGDSSHAKGIIRKTTNGGINWFNQNSSTNYSLKSVTFINQNVGWAVGISFFPSLSKIIGTSNGGSTWVSQLEWGYWLYSVFFVNESTGWAVADESYTFGRIFKTTNGGNPIAINPISFEIPDKLSLSQNFPNPFNPITNISFAIPNPSFVKLVVNDLLGREIITLVSENLIAGSYKVDWNASAYSSGVYFCKLQAGDFTDIKKMILIK